MIELSKGINEEDETFYELSYKSQINSIDDFTLSHIIFCSHRLKNHLIFNIVYYTYRFSSAGYKKQQQPLTILKRVVQDKACD